MNRNAVERALRDVHERLVRERSELQVLEEQLMVLNDVAEDARVRSLVSETPLAAHEYTDAQRSVDATNRGRSALKGSIDALERKQDELLDQLQL